MPFTESAWSIKRVANVFSIIFSTYFDFDFQVGDGYILTIATMIITIVSFFTTLINIIISYLFYYYCYYYYYYYYLHYSTIVAFEMSLSWFF